MFNKRVLSFIMAAAMSVSAVGAVSAGVSADWVKSENGYSYKSEKTGKKLTGWQTIGEGKYYFDKNGYAAMGWKKFGDDYYYFSKQKKGLMLTGWNKIGEDRYYFGTDGKMRTGFVKISGKTYYFGTNGKMRTGKIKIKDKTYDFGKDGVLKTSADTSAEKTSSTTSKMMAPLKGLKWGMGVDDVIDKCNFSKYYIQGPMLMVYDKEPFVYYLFSSDDKLSAFGNVSYDDSKALSKYRSDFKNDGWKYTMNGKEEGFRYYVYQKGTQFAAVYDYDSGMVATFILSNATLDQLSDGTAFDEIFGV